MSMPEASLLTPEIRALIGTGNEPVAVTITPAAVRRSMRAVFGEIATPTFAPGEEVPGYVLIALQPEGDELPMPDLMPDKLEVSNEIDIVRPLRMGETLQVRSRIGHIAERLGGRFGYSLLIRMDVEFSEPGGAVVARFSFTAMQYDASAALDAPGDGVEPR
ncbi:MAG: hypothetical protein IT303_06930 [Dehalococcoidia bacterium]|nr:hypothetical protein [Dehalococcoidia bacterium]